MNPDFSLASILARWKEELAELYPEGEIAAMFRITLEDVLEMDKGRQLSVWNENLTDGALEKLDKLLEELVTGKPLQQVIGFTFFDDLKLLVSPEVLIPRPETEELVYQIVRSLPVGFTGRLIDWCTGSGCIALALKKHFPAAEIIGYDVSEGALAIARRNAGSNRLEVDFRFGNALEEVPLSSPAEVIVSNPPYIPIEERAAMHKNVVQFEPGLALFVPNGEPQLFYKAIVGKAIRDLSSGGWLFFELHERYAHETKELVESSGEFDAVEIVTDLQGKDRMLKAIRR